MKTPTMAKTAIYAAVAKRSITINGRSTSISLEPDFWNAIKDFALKNHITIPEVIASIDKERGEANMSSAVRVFCFRQAKTQEG